MNRRVKATLRVMVGTIIVAILGVLFVPFTYCGLNSVEWEKNWNVVFGLAALYAYIVPILWLLFWHAEKKSQYIDSETERYLMRLDSTRQYVQITIIILSIMLYKYHELFTRP